MTDKLQRLELTWPGKEDRFNPEPRILLEDKEKSYSAPDSLMQGIVERMGLEQKVQPTFDNMLIHGDNLLALKALEQDYAGKVKCIYIDPPFNTGNAFEHYDDGLEHSIWLSLMRDRLEILKRLLSNDGFIAIHLDDVETAYCKIIMDEVFGRNNYLNTITMTTNEPSGFKSTSSSLFSTANYILLYAKDKSLSKIKRIYIEKQYDPAYSKVIKNISEPYSNWKFENIADVICCEKGFSSLKEAKKHLGEDYFCKLIAQYALKNADRVFRTAAIGGGAKLKRQVTISQSKINRNIVMMHPNEDVPNFYILNGEQILFYKNRLGLIDGELKPVQSITDVWTDISWTGIANEGKVEFKNGKKPEKLIQRILEMCTNPGDLVLDSFLGSGTTAAVAHKMGRRWIGVEMGDHVYTHCLPRLKKVINGEDAGGVTKSTGWLCGGGFKFYELASSLIVKDKYGQQIISDKYNADMLAEAMCKILGYHYKPDSTAYWKQGYSSEKSFIYTTTFSMQEASLERLHEEVGDNNLLVCCSAFSGNSKVYPNISVKKIPAAILKKCEWGREGYPLNLTNYHPDDKEFEFDEEESED